MTDVTKKRLLCEVDEIVPPIGDIFGRTVDGIRSPTEVNV